MHDSPSNRQAFKELIITMAVRERRSMLFAGAGVSSQAGYPTWSELMQSFHQRVTERTDTRVDEMPSPDIPTEEEGQQHGLGKAACYILKMKDPLWQAEAYLRELREEAFYSVIRKEFSDRPTDQVQLYGILTGFGFNHVLTTNFDRSLERVFAKVPGRPLVVIEWTDRRKIRHLLRWLNEERQERFFVYLHGVYDKRETIVLTESQYKDRYILSDDANKKLLALLMTQTILFVGFSAEDPQFQFLFRTLSAHLGPGIPSHFILLRASPDEHENLALQAMFDQKYCLQTVFYANTSRHTDLAPTLEQLSNSLAYVARPAKPRLEANPSGALDIYKTIVETEISDQTWERIWGLTAPSAISRYPTPLAAGPVKAGEPLQSSNVPDPEDPNKGQFGGSAKQDGYVLEAKVNRTDDPDWFDITLIVRAAEGGTLTQGVIFHLHPTFRRSKVRVEPVQNVATLERTAYGAFTVGVEIQGTPIRLELDLAELPDAPALFRAR